MDYEAFIDGYHGRLTTAPDTALQTARVYILSDRADFDVEKVVLLKKIYAKLKSRCREKFNINFEVLYQLNRI